MNNENRRNNSENGEIVINEGKETITVIVKHTGDRPVQVGSHFHFLR